MFLENKSLIIYHCLVSYIQWSFAKHGQFDEASGCVVECRICNRQVRISAEAISHQL